MLKQKFARNALIAALAVTGAPAMAESVVLIDVTMKAMGVSNEKNDATNKALNAARNLCVRDGGNVAGSYRVEQAEVHGIYYSGVDLLCRFR
jgi:hypothetical protein